MYSNRAITAEDIAIWIDDFTKATEVISRMEEGLPGDRRFLKGRLEDAMFLIAYAESTLAAEVGDEVYDRAIELQKRLESEDE